MKKTITSSVFLLFSLLLIAQNPNKKTMGHEVFDIWNTISKPMISNDGNWVVYNLNNEGRDPQLLLYHAPTQQTKTFPRGSGAQFSADNDWLVFKIKQPQDSIKALRRKKVKKNKLPKDSMGIYQLDLAQLTTIPNVKSFVLPKKWSGWLAYHLEESIAARDTSKKDQPKNKGSKKKKKKKRANKKNGTPLVIRNLSNGVEQKFEFVKNYTSAEEGQRFAFSSTGNDSTWLAGVYLFDCKDQKSQIVHQQKGKYKQLVFDKKGTQLSFVAETDTSKALFKPFALYLWQNKDSKAERITQLVNTHDDEKYWVSEHFKPYFSRNGQRLYFGAAPPPILKDTTLLPEEMVQVEVWSSTDARLHTEQKVLLDKEKKRSYLSVLNIKKKTIKQLGHRNLANVQSGDEGKSPYILAYNELPYLQNTSWSGFPVEKDVVLIDQRNGQQQTVATQLRARPRFSPKANYLYWFSRPDTAWFAYSVDQKQPIRLTNNNKFSFYNELNDIPQYPSSYGIAGWTKGDQSMLIYDRYDLWKVDPKQPQKAQRLTNGRAQQIRYRYIRLDREKRNIDPAERILLYVFDEKTKASGYAYLSIKNGKLETIIKENFRFSNRPIKAKDADRIVFTKEDFDRFPDLQYARMDFKNAKTISQANPQQTDYSWGSIEMYEWTNLHGEKMEGLLVKPENFDPKKKYPMIVNFYERSSDRLHRHRAPYPHRSTINYAFYANRGYVIFNPDVKYRVGYPGESAYNCVIPGVTALIAEGFVDEQNIGVQGHSWGGYQIAHLITKTNMFKCAESGAPVVNMFSAYGGIRWGSGLSRMFQYEHTQSRIGGTIWEYPLRYLENSPLFSLDKVETPVLILHNDNDGAVPWYQGIEFFVAMRRLNKPAWLLNYNKEPHWPLKRENRLDFNKRMAQFFDHYLKDAPKPSWMKRGVPAIEKGIRQGFEID